MSRNNKSAEIELAISLLESEIERLSSLLANVREDLFELREMSVRDRRGRSAAKRSQVTGLSTPALSASFRGSSEEIRSRYESLAADFAGLSPVIDLACGAGEFVSLLCDVGIEASGIDIDEESVEVGRAAGLDLYVNSINQWLSSANDHSYGGVSMLHVVEHLAIDELPYVFQELRRVVRPDGVLVVEFPSPHSLYSLSKYWTDPTHGFPLDPDYVAQLLEACGFRVEISYVHPPPFSVVLREDPAASSIFNQNGAAVNGVLFGAMDVRLECRQR